MRTYEGNRYDGIELDDERGLEQRYDTEYKIRSVDANHAKSLWETMTQNHEDGIQF